MDITDEIKDKLDIVEFIQQYLPLKKAGVNYQGICPFHDEKTPSFMVSPERQTYKCFGCGKGGDVLSFVMEKEGLSFPEALQMLAEKTNTKLPEQGQYKPQQISLKKKIFELNQLCADFWHQILLKHPKANEARLYLQKKRGIPEELIKEFQLGFAPPPNTTFEMLSKHGFSKDDIRQAGEPTRFSGRIVFPIADITGRIVGFTGRLLPSAEKDINRPVGPKYWNTPETPLFKKSEALYGLHLAKDAMRKENVVIMAEGQTDVIGLFMAGLTNAVASSGTSLTEQQVRIIARFAREITFAYDADTAGQSAAERGFHIALAADLNPTVMQLPEGEDPGSLATKKASILKRSYESRQPVIQWLLNLSIKEHGLAQPAAKKKIAKAILPWVARIEDAVERFSWLDTISEQINIPTDVLKEELEKNKGQKTPTSAKPKETTVNYAAELLNDPLTLIMGLIGLHPTLIEDCAYLEQLTKDNSWYSVWQHLANQKELGREEKNRLNESILIVEKEFSGSSQNELHQEIAQLYQRAKVEYNRKIKQKLLEEIAEAEGKGDKTVVNSLMERLSSATIQEDDKTTS